jgi:glycogen operon protein
MRNLLGTLLLAAGTPMITAGDERGRTQHGNNNAYCQDNEISWTTWDPVPWRDDLQATTRHLLHLRRQHRALRARHFYLGQPRETTGIPDLDWRTAWDAPFDHGQWHDPAVRALQMVRTAADGSCVLLVVNGMFDPVAVTLTTGRAERWELAWDSVWEHPDEVRGAAIAGSLHALPGERVLVDGLSLRLYVAVPAE